MAPETFDISNFVITDRADIYAFGVILWEMLAGRRPWPGNSMVQIALAVSLRGERPPLDALPPARCPPKLRALIAECWDSVPERRPAAPELAKRLELVRQGLASAVPASIPSFRSDGGPAGPPGSNKPGVKGAAGAAAALLSPGHGVSPVRVLLSDGGSMPAEPFVT